MCPDPAEAENLFASNISKDGLIVCVEPSDLKNVWKMAEELRDQPWSKENMALNRRMFAKVCSPGANVVAIECRGTILRLIVKQIRLLPPDLSSDAWDIVFNIAARFPIKSGKPGVDLKAFVKQIEDELRQRGFKV